jgi:hypothetical protein
MRSMLISPLLVLAAMPLLTMPAPARAAEAAVNVDPISVILRAFEKDAVFTGRTPEGTGYVVMSMNRAYLIRPQPGGIVRIVVLNENAVRSLVASSGWRL